MQVSCCLCLISCSEKWTVLELGSSALWKWGCWNRKHTEMLNAASENHIIVLTIKVSCLALIKQGTSTKFFVVINFLFSRCLSWANVLIDRNAEHYLLQLRWIMIFNLNMKSFIMVLNTMFRASQQCTSKWEDTFDLHLSVPQLNAALILQEFVTLN